MPNPSFEPGSAVQPAGAGTSGAWGQTQSRSRSNKGVVAAVLSLLAAAGLAVAGFVVWHGQSAAARPGTDDHAASAPSLKGEPSAIAPTAGPVAPAAMAGAAVEAPSAAPLALTPPAPSTAPSKAPSPPLGLKKRSGGAAHSSAQPDLFDDNK